MKQQSLKLHVTASSITSCLFLLFFGLSPMVFGQVIPCNSSKDCQRKSEELRNKAAALTKQKAAKEAELNRRKKENARREEQQRREDEEWRKRNPGLGRTRQPLESDDLRPLSDEIRALDQEHQRLQQQAGDLETRARQFSTPPRVPAPPPKRQDQQVQPVEPPRCFIATAAYGSPMADDVITLRAFRDSQLLTNPAGRGFVQFYEAYSPSIADYIARDETLRVIVRVLLAPLVYSVKYPLRTGIYFLIAIASFWLAVRHKNFSCDRRRDLRKSLGKGPPGIFML